MMRDPDRLPQSGQKSACRAALASTVSYTMTALIVLIAFTRVSNTCWWTTIIVQPEDVRIYSGVISSAIRRVSGGQRVVNHG